MNTFDRFLQISFDLCEYPSNDRKNSNYIVFSVYHCDVFSLKTDFCEDFLPGRKSQFIQISIIA